MIRKTFGVLTPAIVAMLVLVLAGVVYAQRDGDGMRGGMMGMMSMMQSCPMMSAAAQGPRAALQHREELGLDDAQVRRLEAIQSQARQNRTETMQRMQDIHQEIAHATAAEGFDEQAVRAAYQRMGELHSDMGVAMARAAHETRNVLTPEQHRQLGGMGGMQGMMRNCPMVQGMRGGEGMMENCPMMRGGMGGMQMEGAEGDRTHPART